MLGWDTTLTAAADAVVPAVLLLPALLVTRLLARALLAGLGRLPGSIGRCAAAAGALLRPGFARRVVVAALGLGTPALTAIAAAPPAAASALAMPTTHSMPSALTTPTRVAVPTTVAAPAAHRATDQVVVVLGGDTLWDIARRHLPSSATPADVARAWPRWYTANRAAIGPDPALLRPGTRLRSPDRRPAGTPASSHDRPTATRTDSGAVARSLDPDRR